MPQIIDALIVTLGLDPSKFTSGQKQAVAQYKQTQDELRKRSQDIERTSKTTGESLLQLQKQLLRIFAVIAGGRGIAQLSEDITNADSAAGRLSRQLGISQETLTAWQGAVRLVGGSAASVSSSFESLAQDIAHFQLTGQSTVLPYLNSLNISLVDGAGHLKKVSEIYLEVADVIQRRKIDPTVATNLLRSIGADPGMIPLILKGRQAIEGMLAEQEKIGAATKRDTDAAEARVAAWNKMIESAEGLWRTLETNLTPAIVSMTKEMGGFFENVNRGLNRVLELWNKLVDLSSKGIMGLFNGSSPETVPSVPGSVPITPRTRARTSSSSAQPLPQKVTQTDVDKLVGMGWTREQAIGIAANIQRESGGSTTSVGDSGKAYGLAQWHPDRQAAFARWAGHSIQGSTRDEQLAFINYELRNSEGRAGKALSATTDVQSAARVVSMLYERPARTAYEANLRAGIAANYANNNSRASNVSNATNDTKIGQIVVNTKATDAAGIAQDIGPAIARNNLAAQANYGAN